jgi:hypothetical protein
VGATQDTMSSWGEDLQRYQAQKHHAPVIERQEHYTRKSKGLHLDKTGTRDFDIISNTIPNPATRESFHSTQARLTETHIKRGIAKEMSAANHGYNILSMQPRFGMSDDAIRTMGGNQEQRGKRMFDIPENYHIITMEPKRQEVLDAEVAEAEKAIRRTSRRPRRATNIVNHRYLVDNDNRAAADEEERRRRLDIIADASSKFNPVSGKFRRLETEEADLLKKSSAEAKQREVVANHTYQVSTLVGRSEGHAYDIVCNHLYNPDYVLNLERERSRGIPQRAKLRQEWEQQRDVDEAMREDDARRAESRTKPERINEVLRRGHELLSNKPFGLSQEEVRAAGIEEDAPVKEATIRPVKPLSVLNQRSVLERLEDSAKNREWRETQVLRETGPRTTTERVFHSAPSRSMLGVSTFEGRSKLLLPTLEKTLTEKNSMRQFW